MHKFLKNHGMNVKIHFKYNKIIKKNKNNNQYKY